MFPLCYGAGGDHYNIGDSNQPSFAPLQRISESDAECSWAEEWIASLMQLVLGVGIAFIEGFSTSTAELQDIFVVIGASVVLLALVKSLPDVCAGIINGSHARLGYCGECRVHG